MTFNAWAVAGIILLAFGIIIGNLMLLKYTAKFKLPSREDLLDPVAKAKKRQEAEQSSNNE